MWYFILFPGSSGVDEDKLFTQQLKEEEENISQKLLSLRKDVGARSELRRPLGSVFQSIVLMSVFLLSWLKLWCLLTLSTRATFCSRLSPDGRREVLVACITAFCRHTQNVLGLFFFFIFSCVFR